LAVRNIAFIVFLFPVVISIFFGTVVLGEILKEPDRELNMWPFEEKGGFFQDAGISSSAIKIIGLEEQYSKSKPIEITISIIDPIFDCGDLYITIYDITKNPKEVVTQSGFFGQCYNKNNLMMPIEDKYSETIDEPGQYEIEAEIYDINFKKTLTTSMRFIVN
jgi:hypothetical protein